MILKTSWQKVDREVVVPLVDFTVGSIVDAVTEGWAVVVDIDADKNLANLFSLRDQRMYPYDYHVVNGIVAIKRHDFYDELCSGMSKQIALEIDKEIIRDLQKQFS